MILQQRDRSVKTPFPPNRQKSRMWLSTGTGGGVTGLQVTAQPYFTDAARLQLPMFSSQKSRFSFSTRVWLVESDQPANENHPG